jgi:hypothetical protein
MNGPDCRWCGTATDAEFVDVGVGFVQVSGGQCWKCLAYEMGPYMTDGRISEVEMATLWLGPFEDSADHSPFNPDQQDPPL